MTPQELIDTKIAPCLRGGHVWRETKLFGCETCSAEHDGFACDVCSRVVDAIHDKNLFAAIAEIGLYLPEENSENDNP